MGRGQTSTGCQSHAASATLDEVVGTAHPSWSVTFRPEWE